MLEQQYEREQNQAKAQAQSNQCGTAVPPKQTLSQLFCEAIAELEKQIASLKADRNVFQRSSNQWEAVADWYCNLLVEQANLSTRPLIFMDVNNHTDQLNQEIAEKNSRILKLQEESAYLQKANTDKTQQIATLERLQANQAETIQDLQYKIAKTKRYLAPSTGSFFVRASIINDLLEGK